MERSSQLTDGTSKTLAIALHYCYIVGYGAADLTGTARIRAGQQACHPIEHLKGRAAILLAPPLMIAVLMLVRCLYLDEDTHEALANSKVGSPPPPATAPGQ